VDAHSDKVQQSSLPALPALPCHRIGYLGCSCLAHPTTTETMVDLLVLDRTLKALTRHYFLRFLRVLRPDGLLLPAVLIFDP
jgi:hypothetical protein